MKTTKLFSFLVTVILMISCSVDDELEFKKDITTNRINECIQDCDIDDDDGGGGGPGGGNTGGGTQTWSKYFYTHRGETNRNIYYAKSNNGTTWTTHQLGLGAQTNEGTASVIFKNRRLLFYKGNSSPNIFYAYKNSPTSTWQGNNWINNNSNDSRTDKSVSATVFNNKVFVAHRGETNKALYLSYSTTSSGLGNYAQVQALSTGNNVDEFTIVENGGYMNIFWTKTSENDKRIYLTRSIDPTNPSMWTYMGEVSGLNGYNGLSAVSLNGSIYLSLGIRETHPTNNLIIKRKVAFVKMGPGRLATNAVIYNYRTQRRPGIMATDDSNLLISFAGESTDRINTMKVDTSGNVLIAPYESGGETKFGGVFSYSIFN